MPPISSPDPQESHRETFDLTLRQLVGVFETAEFEDQSPEAVSLRSRRLRQLRKALYWTPILNASFRGFLWHVGVLRYGMTGLGIAGCLVLLRAILSADNSPSLVTQDLPLVCVLGFSMGFLYASSRWSELCILVAEAEEYRQIWVRHAREALKSTAEADRAT